jgi:hypothetical protein
MFTNDELRTIENLAKGQLESRVRDTDDIALELESLPTSSFDCGNEPDGLREVQNCQSIIRRCKDKLYNKGKLKMSQDHSSIDKEEEANMGLATTRELLEEITARIEVDGKLDYKTVR